MQRVSLFAVNISLDSIHDRTALESPGSLVALVSARFRRYYHPRLAVVEFYPLLGSSNLSARFETPHR